MAAISRMFCALLLCLAVAAGVSAQTHATPGDIKTFVTQYVAANNAKDVARVLSFYGPKTLACITPQTKDYYYGAMAVQMRDQIPPNYTFSVLSVNENNLKAIESFAHFPVHPEKELHIDYQQGEESGSVVIWLIQQNGRWYADQPCVSEQALKQFRDEAPAREAAMARYKALAAGIKQPLRSELLAMIREHNTASASTRYQQASGESAQTAMFVINQLKQDATSAGAH